MSRAFEHALVLGMPRLLTRLFFLGTFGPVYLPDDTVVFALFARTKFSSGGSRRAVKDVAVVIDSPALGFGTADPTPKLDFVCDSREEKSGN
jgi:hypothetical protein